MTQADFFIIDYKLHGEPKRFTIRATLMNNVEAWQWASCDAGLVPIPKPGRPPLKRFSKPMAERFGVKDVKWRKSVAIVLEEDHT